MSDNTSYVIVLVSLLLSITGCTVGTRWAVAYDNAHTSACGARP